MSKKVVTFGEVMMRFSPPGHAKFSQATTVELTYGGGEANVAMSLAYFGMDAFHVTCFPDNLVGKSARAILCEEPGCRRGQRRYYFLRRCRRNGSPRHH